MAHKTNVAEHTIDLAMAGCVVARLAVARLAAPDDTYHTPEIHEAHRAEALPAHEAPKAASADRAEAIRALVRRVGAFEQSEHFDS